MTKKAAISGSYSPMLRTAATSRRTPATVVLVENFKRGLLRFAKNQGSCKRPLARDRERRDIPPFPARHRFSLEIGKASGRDGRAHSRHQLLVIGEIDLRQQHRAHHLVRPAPVEQISGG